MTPEKALKRGGHRFPKQILSDLNAEGYVVKEANVPQTKNVITARESNMFIFGMILAFVLSNLAWVIVTRL